MKGINRGGRLYLYMLATRTGMTKAPQLKKPTPTIATLFLSLPLLFSGPSIAADYNVVDLGANVTPRDINNIGEIAGARNADQYPNFAIRGLPGSFEDIDGTASYAINEDGVVVGTTISGAFVLDGNSLRSWDEQGAWGVNGLGQAAGNKAGKNPYRATSIPYNPAIYDGSKWVVMDIAQVYPRGTRQGVYADQFVLFDVNDGGFAVGRKSRYGLAGSAAILIEPPYSDIKSLSDVVYLPTGGSANAINEQNLIVGTSANSSSEPAFAFLYDGVTVQNLGTLGGARSGANDINELNEVVGYSETSTGNHAFLWDGAMQDLNDLISDPDWVLESALAINEAGEIVGAGLLNGESHGFLLTVGAPPPPMPGNNAPVAVISADTTCGKAPLTVRFDSMGSSDQDGDELSYSWDFGDGSSATGARTEHAYTTNGTYISSLTVDDGQTSDLAQLDITVKNGKCKGR
jgi:probable HAF family extracellular repeat protein